MIARQTRWSKKKKRKEKKADPVFESVCQNKIITDMQYTKEKEFHAETAVCCNLENLQCQDSNKSGVMRSTLLYYSKRKWTLKSHQCLQSGDKEQSSLCLWQMNLRLNLTFEPQREKKHIYVYT